VNSFADKTEFQAENSAISAVLESGIKDGTETSFYSIDAPE
jgi:hypothetical protein